MNDMRIEPQWLMTAAALLVLVTGGYMAYGAYQRRSRRKGLLARLERIGYHAAHQVLVPDGMGGFIHIDHLLLTPRGVLVLDTRRVAGLIFGGDHQSQTETRGDAGRHRSRVSGRRSGTDEFFGVRRVHGRLERLGRAAAAQPAHVHESLSPKNFTAHCVEETATLSHDSFLMCATVCAMCTRYLGSLRRDFGGGFKSRGNR